MPNCLRVTCCPLPRCSGIYFPAMAEQVVKTLGLALVSRGWDCWRIQTSTVLHRRAWDQLSSSGALHLLLSCRCNSLPMPSHTPADGPVPVQVVIFGSAMDIAAIQQDTPQARRRAQGCAAAPLAPGRCCWLAGVCQPAARH